MVEITLVGELYLDSATVNKPQIPGGKPQLCASKGHGSCGQPGQGDDAKGIDFYMYLVTT